MVIGDPSGGALTGECRIVTDLRVLASDLKFPEGPVAMPDGSVILVEIAGGTVTRIGSDGSKTVVANVGGGPNGLALGPNAVLYVCNNGGNEYRQGGFVATGPAKDYDGGYIQRVDLHTGETVRLYSQVGPHKLSAPNDIVFDQHGGFYFTDLGKRRVRSRDEGGVYYALPDGSKIIEVVHPMLTPNGIGLSADNNILYVAETETSRLFAFDVLAPGAVEKRPIPAPYGGRLVCGLPGFQRFDSLALDALGNICVTTMMTGYITVIAPDGAVLRQVKMPDILPTNICFGDPDLRTAFITLSGVGQLVSMEWPEPGLRLNYQL